MNPLLLTDFYKTEHHRMYPDGTSLIYSNFTPRKSRMAGVDKVVVFGLQHFMKTYLIDMFNTEFFQKPIAEIESEYKRHINVDIEHILKLHKLQYLPIEIKALPEGSRCPIGIPMLTIKNTHPDFGWLTNYLESLMSCMLWQPVTSATIAYEYKKILSKFAIETTGNADGVQWQGHDFSMRGMSSVESAILSGMGHLTSFTGTDTIPAIYQLEKSYNASGLIGASVPATEHSVMCMGSKEGEIESFSRLLDLYPEGILSVVSDTWDLWKVCTEYLPKLKDKVLARNGKLVIRPDSGDPVDIICGANNGVRVVKKNNQKILSTGTEFIFLGDEDRITYIKTGKYNSDDYEVYERNNQDKGVIELLWDIFGGTISEQGYKVLDSHIGAIYGDSITLDRATQICERLKAKGFASTNIVLGIGSYTYQYNTRDTFGFAMKATYGEVGTGYAVDCRQIFKDPITDDGTKKSKKGLLMVVKDNNGDYICLDEKTKFEETQGELKTVFLNSQITKEFTLDEIRNELK